MCICMYILSFFLAFDLIILFIIIIGVICIRIIYEFQERKIRVTDIFLFV